MKTNLHKGDDLLIKKTLAVFLMFVLIFTLNYNVFADTSTDDANKLKQVQNTKKDLQSKVEALDKEINDVLTKIDMNKKDMNKMAQNIKDSQLRLDNEEKSIRLQTYLMNKRLRALYMCNGTGYLEVILNSSSFSDFLSRIDTISRIMKYDKELIKNIEEQRDAEAKQKETLVTENGKLEALKASNTNILTKLNSDIKQQNDLLSKATEQEKQIIAEQKAKELAEQKARELAAAQAKARETAAAQAAPKNNTSLLAAPSAGGPKAGSYSKVLNMEATAYSGSGFASYGSQVTRNPNGYSIIAVDPSVIPIHSKVYVSGYGYAYADDTGLLIRGDIIDVYFPTDADANAWGRQNVQVYILN